MNFDDRADALVVRLDGVKAVLAKVWSDEAREASLEARRSTQGLLPKPQLSSGPVGDKRYRYSLLNGHVVDIFDRPAGYRGGGSRFMVRHTGPGGSHLGTAFADSMVGARHRASQAMRGMNRFGSVLPS